MGERASKINNIISVVIGGSVCPHMDTLHAYARTLNWFVDQLNVHQSTCKWSTHVRRSVSKRVQPATAHACVVSKSICGVQLSCKLPVGVHGVALFHDR